EGDHPRDVTIIPGAGLPVYHSLGPRRKRPLTMQLLVMVVVACLLLSASFSVGPLADFASSAGANPFNALANAVNLNAQGPWVLYRARVGDTFNSIAAQYNLKTPNGIYELNNLFLTNDPQIGEQYKIPTDPTYGETFKIPLGVANLSGSLYPQTNVEPNDGWLFDAVGGVDNGPGGTCAPNAATALNNAQAYQLEAPDPGSHYVRGFTTYHDGIDMSTGVIGTPLVAAQSGQVIFSGWDAGGGGNSVKINLCDGLAISYSHMTDLIMHVGQNVNKGQTVGHQGSTGNSTGAHLHYMLWYHNTPIDAFCAYSSSSPLLGYYTPGHDPDYNPPLSGCPPTLNTASPWYVG
ncbi:MAG TPA: LysM peptidoglycan-binding domain-containing M23 family metallopeptidase, partial [Ktedonobacterales bacterium]|nr:LysM peptidoglycan-binding domain-containing M23 family metallopeptidase [Ktedonobacterales bacterium]